VPTPIVAVARGRIWERIRIFARQHRADVIPVHLTDLATRTLGTGVSYAPFNHNLALHWRKRLVYVAAERLNRPYTVGGIIHELGHILASRDSPSLSREIVFAGWEHQVSIITDCRHAWLKNMETYETTHGSFTSLSQGEKRAWYRDMIICGKDYGNLDRHGLPVAVR
jgi:hypothetical protein